MRILSVVLVATAMACSARIPEPPRAGQPTSALVEVDYPPPPARVEFVPPQPQSDAAWIRGSWEWQGHRWEWKQGAWVVVPEGAAYAMPVLVRRGDGRLFFAAGSWRDPSGKEAVTQIHADAGSAD
jgi:hypothetical protein